MEYILQWNKHYKKRIMSVFVRSRFLKTKINFLLISFLTMILQLHVNISLCYLLTFHPYVDFFIQIIITIIIGFYTNLFLNFVLLFEDRIYSIPRYFINNYSEERYRIWKRNFIFIISTYFIVIILYHKLDKFEIILQVIQTITSFLILDEIQAPKNVNKIKTKITFDPITKCTTYSKIYERGDLKIKQE